VLPAGGVEQSLYNNAKRGAENIARGSRPLSSPSLRHPLPPYIRRSPQIRYNALARSHALAFVATATPPPPPPLPAEPPHERAAAALAGVENAQGSASGDVGGGSGEHAGGDSNRGTVAGSSGNTRGSSFGDTGGGSSADTRGEAAWAAVAGCAILVPCSVQPSARLANSRVLAGLHMRSERPGSKVDQLKASAAAAAAAGTASAMVASAEAAAAAGRGLGGGTGQLKSVSATTAATASAAASPEDWRGVEDGAGQKRRLGGGVEGEGAAGGLAPEVGDGVATTTTVQADGCERARKWY
jgi:hypothetical protein